MHNAHLVFLKRYDKTCFFTKRHLKSVKWQKIPCRALKIPAINYNTNVLDKIKKDVKPLKWSQAAMFLTLRLAAVNISTRKKSFACLSDKTLDLLPCQHV